MSSVRAKNKTTGGPCTSYSSRSYEYVPDWLALRIIIIIEPSTVQCFAPYHGTEPYKENHSPESRSMDRNIHLLIIFCFDPSKRVIGTTHQHTNTPTTSQLTSKPTNHRYVPTVLHCTAIVVVYWDRTYYWKTIEPKSNQNRDQTEPWLIHSLSLSITLYQDEPNQIPLNHK